MHLPKKSLLILAIISGILTLYRFAIIISMVFGYDAVITGIGIIGSNDGPTAVYTANGLQSYVLLKILFSVLELFFCIFVFILSVKTLYKNKNKQVNE